MIDIALIFYSLALISVIAMLTSLIALRFTLTRRLKKKILDDGDFYFFSGTIDFDFLNTILFAGVCAIPKIKKLKNYNNFVSKNVDVREFANWYESALATIYIFSLAYLVAASALYYLAGLFGLI